MWFRILIISLFVFLLSVWQISFIGALSFPLNGINFLLIILSVFPKISEKKSNIWIFALAGFIFDVFYLTSFPVFILVWSLVFILCHFLFSVVFTDRSLFSALAVGVFSVFSFFSLINLYFLLVEIFSPSEVSKIFFLSQGFWQFILYSLILNSIVVFFLFYIVNFLTKRLRPMFIIKY